MYGVGKATPRVKVDLDGWFSHVAGKGRRLWNQQGGVVRLPVAAQVQPAEGSDGQVIFLDRRTGDEWGFWQFERRGDGYHATNGYHYNTRWSAVPPGGRGGATFVSRGAGVPYLTGLVRPCEVARGRINHALAFGYPSPSPDHVYPATKSDGRGIAGLDLPEGTRLQLDPSLTARQLADLGCTRVCLTIARALQRYGMYVIDHSGRPKLMMEYEATAHWHGRLNEKTVQPIPLSAFGVVVDTTPDLQALASGGRAGRAVRVRYSVFDRGDATRESVTITVGSRVVRGIKRAYHVPSAFRPTSVIWRPRRPGTYSFCVRASDPAGHESSISCAPLTVR